MLSKKLLFFSTLILCITFSHRQVNAVTVNGREISTGAEIFFAPQTGSFIEGTTFDVPIFINTRGSSINTIELNIKFDADKINVVKPSGGKSIIGLWVESPVYDNTKGTLRFTGVIPNGINSNSGLIATMSFVAKSTGQATISVRDSSHILTNDGVGTPINYESNRATYTILPKPPEGVTIFSETHPFQNRWYNNKNATLAWNQDTGVTGFSVAFDNKPTTIPGNTVTNTEPIQTYENLGDGLWYIHVKALKRGVWGSTSHFAVKIDATPPASFTPEINFLTAVVINRALVSFFTTDSLSGMDHYEVGVIDKSKAVSESPTFFQTESPYQIPFESIENSRVIVRAVDLAGNIRDEYIDVKMPFLPWKFIMDHLVIILASIIALIILLILFHYLFGHSIVRHIRRALQIVKKEEARESYNDIKVNTQSKSTKKKK